MSGSSRSERTQGLLLWGELSLAWGGEEGFFSSLRQAGKSKVCMENAFDRAGPWLKSPYPSVAYAGLPK